MSETRLKTMRRPINLVKGWPATSLLPSLLLAEGAKSVLAHEPIATRRSLEYKDLSVTEKALLYGPDEGHLPLRESLGVWLADFYRPAVRAAYLGPAADYSIPHGRIDITGGASQSLAVILDCLTDPSFTRNVWVVAPGYFLAFKIFEDAGFYDRMVSIPETKDGPDVGWLRREIQKREELWALERKKSGQVDEPCFHKKEKYPKTFKHVIYTVPNFSNPGGVTTSLETREDLVRLARDFDALIVCDDVYDMLHWPSDTQSAEGAALMASKSAILPRIVDVDRFTSTKPDGFGNVISNGTFSKICAPGVRCGWVEASEKLAFLISTNGGTKSGGAPSQMTSTFINSLVTSGKLEAHIQNKLRPAYRARWATMMSAIEEYLLPIGVSVKSGARPEIAGGYFLWLYLPPSLSGKSAEVAKRCLENESLAVADGRTCEVPGNEDVRFDSNIRLTFSWEGESELRDGVIRLAAVLQRMINEVDPYNLRS